MKSLVTVLRKAVCLLFPMLFLFSCFSPDKKPVANQKEAKENFHKADTITISMMQFNPEVLKVNKGDTVIWINKGIVPHTVKSYQDNKFYSDTIATDKTWKWVVTDSAAYYCTIHLAAMKGKLVLNLK